MVNPGSGWPRVVRGALLSGACLTLSLAAHSVGGGRVDVSPALVLFGLLLSGTCIAAADTRRGFGGIFTVMALSQVVLHLVAGAGAAPHHAQAVSAAGPGTTMVVAHAAGALLISALLTHGERIAWALCSLLRLPVMALAVRLAPTPPRLATAARLPEPVRHFGIFPSGGPGWRGPPDCAG